MRVTFQVDKICVIYCLVMIVPMAGTVRQDDTVRQNGPEFRTILGRRTSLLTGQTESARERTVSNGIRANIDRMNDARPDG